MSFKHIFTLVAGLIVVLVIFIGGFVAGGGFATEAAAQTYKDRMTTTGAKCFPAENW